jgi:hypothetical protein
LTSRISILKKDISRFQSAASSRNNVVEVKTGAGQKRGNTPHSDMDWTRPKKRIKRTYSGRGGRASHDRRGVSDGIQPSVKDIRRLIPGDISVPTPILNRARRGLVGSQYTASVLDHQDIQPLDNKGKKRLKAKDRDAHFQLSETMREIRRNTPSTRYATYEGIYYGLEALLKVTASDGPEVKRLGPRSLQSMCLGAVPRYIAQEEALLLVQLEETGGKSAINRRDVSTEIYDDLEAFGSMGRGWKPLRTIVRSHGIQVICEAMQDGLLDVEFCGILITLCVNMSATREAEILLSALLSVGIFPEPKTVFTRFDDDIATRPLSIFWNFVEHRSCFSYQYRQLATMIADGLLPIGWLATKEFVTFWTRTIQEISPDSTNPDAINFLNTVLPMLAAYGDSAGRTGRVSETVEAGLLEAVKQAFSSLLTTLSAIVILSKENMVPIEETKASSSSYMEVVTLLQSCLIQWKLCRGSNITGTLLAFAILVVESSYGDPARFDADLVDLLLENLRQTNRSTRLSAALDGLVVFVCSIARCCGRGASNSGFEYLQHLHMLLEGFGDNKGPGDGQIVQEIIVDSAFAFAQQAPGRKHLEYAARMEAKFHVVKRESMLASPVGSSTGRNSVGFRWEEGISEWVAATPAMSCLKSHKATEYSMDETECDTPSCPSAYRQLPKDSVPIILKARPTDSAGLDSTDQYRNMRLPSSPGHGSAQTYDSYDAEDDFITTSPRSKTDSGTDHCESDDELLPSSLQSQTLHANDSFSSTALSWASASSNKSICRRYVDRAPRLSRRILRDSLQCQLFDERDDELSSFPTSSQSNMALRDITNLVGANANANANASTMCRGKRSSERLKSIGGFGESLLGESEDELCI